MKFRTIASVLFALMIMAAVASAQTNPPSGYPSGNAVGPDQPVRPVTPTLVRRDGQPGMNQPGAAAPAAQPQPPFTLTPQEQAELNHVLDLWEKRNKEIKTFDCRYKRWTYDAVFGQANAPKFVDLGAIKFASPDRGMFLTDTTEKDGKNVPIEDTRAEHWISDGKAIIEYNQVKRQVIIHKLPPELQGKAIVNTPLPFLFGAESQKLRERYFLRIVTPRDVTNQIWLEAYPRFQQDAANFHHAQFIINTQGMTPFALKLIQPNAKDNVVYQFYEVVVNDPLRMFQGNPFRAVQPLGWKSIVEEPQSAQAQRPAGGQR